MEKPLVWIDCEMTGLNPETDSIMSVACFVTDSDLNILDEMGFEAVIQHSREELARMGEWCQKHHGSSGLASDCLQSTLTSSQVAGDLLKYIRKFVPEPGTALLAGNSIHADRSFLVRPPFDAVINHLHYRMLDVSTIKEAARRWGPANVMEKLPRKQLLHEARADILESINEAKFYRDMFFHKSV